MTRKFRLGLSRRARALPQPGGPSPGLADALDNLDSFLSEWGQPQKSENGAVPTEPRDHPSLPRGLRYHLAALIYSRRPPYTWIRSACAYALLCVGVLALGWLLVQAVG